MAITFTHLQREALIATALPDRKPMVANFTRPIFKMGKMKKINSRVRVLNALQNYNPVIELTPDGILYTSFLIYGGDFDTEVNLWFYPYWVDMRLTIFAVNKVFHLGCLPQTQIMKTVELLENFEAGDPELTLETIKKLRAKAYTVKIELLATLPL